MIPRIAGLFLALLAVSYGQLTADQKLVEFRQLAGLYARMYAPAEWKKQAVKHDLLDLSVWSERIRTSKDDLEFLELMSEYVSRLEDGHDYFLIRSSFSARLGFTVDIYDGKFLIDRVDRVALPASRFSADTGDELISLDSVTPEEWVKRLRQYGTTGYERSTRRETASLITSRPQFLIPRAHEIGDTARVEIRLKSGETQVFDLRWIKSGEPLTKIGPVTPPWISAAPVRREASSTDPKALWRQLTTWKRRKLDYMVNGVGEIAPVFALPENFVIRSGSGRFDPFYSGTYESEGKKIGYLRIADFAESFPGTTQLRNEVQFMQANTDGLIIDVMRNPGGLGSAVSLLASMLTPDKHRVLGFELRANSLWTQVFSNIVTELKLDEAPEDEIAAWQELLDEVRRANTVPLGRTRPIPLDGDIGLERNGFQLQGNNVAYTKPLMILVDEFSASAADAFPAIMQDNGRAIVAGHRTMGLGGSVISWSLNGYCECDTSITASLMVRKQPVDTAGEFPTAPYVENIGVRPDVPIEYMTAENLASKGKPFVEAFTKAMLEHIAKNQ